MAFEMIPRPVAGELVVRYRAQVWHNEPIPYELEGQAFMAVRCFELNLLEDRVEIRCQFHLLGENAPTKLSGMSVTPEESLAEQTHPAFLSDPSPIEEAGRHWFDEGAWPGILAEAAALIRKAGGRWRRNLEVDNTPEQVDAALAQLREGRSFSTGAVYSDLRYWWDAKAGTFMEERRTENPYSGGVREDVGPISPERMRQVLEGMSGTVLEKHLG